MGRFYSDTKFANSLKLVFVASVILAIVLQDGHRGVPSGENCLLLLNVVASSPLVLLTQNNLIHFFSLMFQLPAKVLYVSSRSPLL